MAGRKKRQKDRQQSDEESAALRKLADAGTHVLLKPGAALTEQDVEIIQAIVAKMQEEFGDE